jgi:hypothetical protein
MARGDLADNHDAIVVPGKDFRGLVRRVIRLHRFDGLRDLGRKAGARDVGGRRNNPGQRLDEAVERRFDERRHIEVVLVIPRVHEADRGAVQRGLADTVSDDRHLSPQIRADEESAFDFFDSGYR